jgi:hypothetical protein
MTNSSVPTRGPGSGDDREADDRRVLPLRPAAGRSLVTLLDAVVAEVAAEREAAGLPSVSIVLDAAGSRIESASLDVVRASLSSLVAAAADAAATAMPRLREVVITALDTTGGLEIEVADSGPGVLPAAVAAVCPAVERIGGTVAWRGCPEGGLAVTLRLPHRRLESRAA